MFDVGILITLLFTIIIFYFSVYFNFKSKKDDALQIEDEIIKNKRIKNISNNISILRIVTIFLTILAILLYLLPKVLKIETNEFDISILLKVVPFRKGFFINSNYKFSYITGMSISGFMALILLGCLVEELSNISFSIIPTFFFVFIMIWVNYFISNIIVSSIIMYFKLISVILNIVGNLIVGLIVFLILFPTTTYLDDLL